MYWYRGYKEHKKFSSSSSLEKSVDASSLDLLGFHIVYSLLDGG